MKGAMGAATAANKRVDASETLHGIWRTRERERSDRDGPAAGRAGSGRHTQRMYEKDKGYRRLNSAARREAWRITLPAEKQRRGLGAVAQRIRRQRAANIAANEAFTPPAPRPTLRVKEEGASQGGGLREEQEGQGNVAEKKRTKRGKRRQRKRAKTEREKEASAKTRIKTTTARRQESSKQMEAVDYNKGIEYVMAWLDEWQHMNRKQKRRKAEQIRKRAVSVKRERVIRRDRQWRNMVEACFKEDESEDEDTEMSGGEAEKAKQVVSGPQDLQLPRSYRLEHLYEAQRRSEREGLSWSEAMEKYEKRKRITLTKIQKQHMSACLNPNHKDMRSGRYHKMQLHMEQWHSGILESKSEDKVLEADLEQADWSARSKEVRRITTVDDAYYSEDNEKKNRGQHSEVKVGGEWYKMDEGGNIVPAGQRKYKKNSRRKGYSSINRETRKEAIREVERRGRVLATIREDEYEEDMVQGLSDSIVDSIKEMHRQQPEGREVIETTREWSRSRIKHEHSKVTMSSSNEEWTSPIDGQEADDRARQKGRQKEGNFLHELMGW